MHNNDYRDKLNEMDVSDDKLYPWWVDFVFLFVLACFGAFMLYIVATFN